MVVRFCHGVHRALHGRPPGGRPMNFAPSHGKGSHVKARGIQHQAVPWRIVTRSILRPTVSHVTHTVVEVTSSAGFPVRRNCSSIVPSHAMSQGSSAHSRESRGRSYCACVCVTLSYCVRPPVDIFGFGFPLGFVPFFSCGNVCERSTSKLICTASFTWSEGKHHSNSSAIGLVNYNNNTPTVITMIMILILLRPR